MLPPPPPLRPDLTLKIVLLKTFTTLPFLNLLCWDVFAVLPQLNYTWEVLHFGYATCNTKPGAKFSFYKACLQINLATFTHAPFFQVMQWFNLTQTCGTSNSFSTVAQFMKLKMSVRVAQTHFQLRHASLEPVINLTYSKLCGITKCTLNTSFLLTMNYSNICGIAKCRLNWL